MSGLTFSNLEQILSGLTKDSLVGIILEVGKILGDSGDETLKTIVGNHVKGLAPKRKFEKKKPPRPIDFNKFRHRHVAIQLQYDGTRYFGFASQAGEHENTVEKHLFEALIKLRLIESRQACGYSRCGRTDKGVSALGQIVAFRLRSAFPLNLPIESIPLHPYDSLSIEEKVILSDDKRNVVNESNTQNVSAQIKLEIDNDQEDQPVAITKKRNRSTCSKLIKELDYCSQLNKTLPEDIKAVGWTEVTDDFNSRFSASHRTYRYFFIRRDLDLEAMTKAATLLVGEHDFRNFCKMNIVSVSNYRREIYSSSITLVREDAACPERSIYRLEISGIAFLWHMVRCIMAVLFLVGERKESPDIVTQLLDIDKVPAKPDYNFADEYPLVLHQCGFDHFIIKYQAKTLQYLTQHLEDLWARHEIAAARARNALDFIRDCYVRADDVNDLMSTFSGHVDDSERAPNSDAKRSRPTTDKADTGDMNIDSSEEQYYVKWAEVWPQVLKSRKESSSYRPLLERKPCLTYDERVSQMSGDRKIRLARTKEKPDEEAGDEGQLCRASTSNLSDEQETARHDSFFAHMRKQGSKE